MLSEYPYPALPVTKLPILQPLKKYEPIGLAELDAAALLDRLDTKYVLTVPQLKSALETLGDHYRILEIDGQRVSPYQTLYFDTPDFELYLRHHDGRRKRFKVRSRRYVANNRSFFEIKLKTNERTVKQRMETGEFLTQLAPQAGVFVDTHTSFDAAALQPQLWNDFARITLAGKAQPERVTLDLDLHFANDTADADFPDLVIAEVKQTRARHSSAFMRQMQAMHIQPMAFSKYCVGVSLLYPDVKHNHFKPTLHAVDKLVHSLPSAVLNKNSYA